MPKKQEQTAPIDREGLKQYRDELKKIKTVSRLVEMEADRVISGGQMMQFCKDVSMYGLYEALLYVGDASLNGAVVKACKCKGNQK